MIAIAHQRKIVRTIRDYYGEYVSLALEGCGEVLVYYQVYELCNPFVTLDSLDPSGWYGLV